MMDSAYADGILANTRSARDQLYEYAHALRTVGLTELADRIHELACVAFDNAEVLRGGLIEPKKTRKR